jgi:hypothetical protein
VCRPAGGRRLGQGQLQVAAAQQQFEAILSIRQEKYGRSGRRNTARMTAAELHTDALGRGEVGVTAVAPAPLVRGSVNSRAPQMLKTPPDGVAGYRLVVCGRVGREPDWR